jgi:hypothetical protein
VGFVAAGAALALAAVFIAQFVRTRFGPCRLPRISISVKFDDDDNNNAGKKTVMTPLRSMGR